MIDASYRISKWRIAAQLVAISTWIAGIVLGVIMLLSVVTTHCETEKDHTQGISRFLCPV
jgi:hypothetical protein